MVPRIQTRDSYSLGLTESSILSPQALADFQRRQELSENISHISQKFSTSDWFQLKRFPEPGVVSLTLSESLFQVLVQFPHATFKKFSCTP